MMNFSFSKRYLAQLLTEETFVCVEIPQTTPQLVLCKPFSVARHKMKKKMLDHCFYFNEDNTLQHKKTKMYWLQANVVPSNFGHKNVLFLCMYNTLISVCASWLTPLTGGVFPPTLVCCRHGPQVENKYVYWQNCCDCELSGFISENQSRQ